MPQVPYQNFTTAQPSSTGTPNVNVSTPAAAFGGNVAEAISGLGHSISHVGDELFTRAIALQQLQNETDAKDADSKYMIKAGELHANYSALQGQDAVKAYPQYSKDLEQSRKDIRNGLGNAQAQKMYDSQSLGTMGRSIFNGAGHAATQQRLWSINTAKAQIDLDAKTVEDNPQDDVLFQNKLNRVRQNANQLSDLQGLGQDSPQSKDLTLKASSQLWAQRIVGLSRTAPFEAAKMLDEHKTKLTGPDYQKVDNTVRSTARAVGSVNIANDVYNAGQSTDEKPSKSLKEMETEVEAKAKEQSPDDPILAQHAIAALRGKYNQAKYADKQADWENSQIVESAIINGTTDIQQLRADPKVAAAIDALPANKQLAIPGQINRYNSQRDTVTNQESYLRLKGMSNNDVEQFLNTDLTKEKLNQHDIRTLMEQQRKLKSMPSADPRVSRAINQIKTSLGSQMEALGIYSRTGNNKEDYDHFTGAVQSALDVWQEAHGKPATYKDVTETIGPQVIQQRAEPGVIWGTNKKPFYNQTVPENFKETVKADVIAKGGVEPTEEQVYRAYIRTQFIKLYGKKEKSE